MCPLLEPRLPATGRNKIPVGSLAYIAKTGKLFWLKMRGSESVTLPSVRRPLESGNDQTVDATVLLRTIQSPIERFGALRAVTRKGLVQLV